MCRATSNANKTAYRETSGIQILTSEVDVSLVRNAVSCCDFTGLTNQTTTTNTVTICNIWTRVVDNQAPLCAGLLVVVAVVQYDIFGVTRKTTDIYLKSCVKRAWDSHYTAVVAVGESGGIWCVSQDAANISECLSCALTLVERNITRVCTACHCSICELSDKTTHVDILAVCAVEGYITAV